MGQLKPIAIALIVLGIAGIIYDLSGLGRERATLKVGDMEATVTEEGGTPVIAIIGGLVLIGGIVMLVSDKRRGG